MTGETDEDLSLSLTVTRAVLSGCLVLLSVCTPCSVVRLACVADTSVLSLDTHIHWSVCGKCENAVYGVL